MLQDLALRRRALVRDDAVIDEYCMAKLLPAR